MKVLFDQNAPRPLARFLTKHVVSRSREMGWELLRNGELLNAAEAAGFEVMVTADKNIRYQQNLSERRIGIVVLPAGRWPAVLPQLQQVVEAIDVATPGSYKEVRRAR